MAHNNVHIHIYTHHPKNFTRNEWMSHICKAAEEEDLDDADLMVREMEVKVRACFHSVGTTEDRIFGAKP